VSRPLLVAEDITARRRLFRLFDVSWLATRYAWAGPLSWTALGFAMALAKPGGAGGARLLIEALGYGVVLYAANILHSVGHVIAGRLVGTPVEAVLVTSTRDVIIYVQPGAAAPAPCRAGRALGGPAANVAVGGALMLAGHLTHASWVSMAGLVNVAVAAWTLMPVPSLDGWVICTSARLGRRPFTGRSSKR
jgi:hypothetical protein